MAHNTAYAVYLSTFLSLIPANYSGSSLKNDFRFFSHQTTKQSKPNEIMSWSESEKERPTYKGGGSRGLSTGAVYGGHLDYWIQVTEFAVSGLMLEERRGEEIWMSWGQKAGAKMCNCQNKLSERKGGIGERGHLFPRIMEELWIRRGRHESQGAMEQRETLTYLVHGWKVIWRLLFTIVISITNSFCLLYIKWGEKSPDGITDNDHCYGFILYKP